MLERHHLRLSAEELWKSWSPSRKSGHKGDILHAYTGIGSVYLEEHKPEGLWIIKPCWEIARYVARTEQRAIHHAVVSYLKSLRYAVGEYLHLTRVKEANDDAYSEMCEAIDLLYPPEGKSEE